MKTAPIALFVYNRPVHTRQTIESLQRNVLSSESKLIIFSDGPKNPSDAEDVAAVRDYIRTIAGFREVTIIKRQENLGLARSIISGVTEVINKYGEIIVLEDDLIFSPHFLAYMNTALTRYEDEERVMQVSGHMFPVELKSETDAIFLPFTTSWGWATWKRAWASYDPLMQGYDALRKDRVIRSRFNLDGAVDYFKMISAQKRGRIDSWAIGWYLCVFMRGGLTLFPVKTLVNNVGFDDSGTHCGYGHRGMNAQLDDDSLVMNYPVVQVDEACKKKVFDCFSEKRSFRKRLLDRLLAWLRW